MTNLPAPQYTLSQQTAALEWLIDTAVPPLRVLQLRGEIADADIDAHLPALEALKRTLDFLAQPWVREELAKGPPWLRKGG